MLNINSLKFFLSIFLTYGILKLTLPIFSKFVFDVPNVRSSHLKNKPTSGGIVFFVISVIGFSLNGNYLPLLTLPLAVVGLIDDIKNLSSKIRFSIQIFTVIVIAFFTDFFNQTFAFFNNNYLYFILIVFIYIFLSCGVINFFNFMDGIDGLVASNIIIVFSVISIKSGLNLAPIIGPLIGFIFLNWSPSKIFMGDVGSTYLGALFVSFLIQANSFLDASSIFILSTPLLLDSFTCLIGRFFKGENIFSAHKSHLYQRLNQAGLSHAYISLIYIFMTLFIAIFYLFFDFKYLSISLIIEIMLGLYLHKKLAVNF